MGLPGGVQPLPSRAAASVSQRFMPVASQRGVLRDLSRGGAYPVPACAHRHRGPTKPLTWPGVAKALALMVGMFLIMGLMAWFLSSKVDASSREFFERADKPVRQIQPQDDLFERKFSRAQESPDDFFARQDYDFENNDFFRRRMTSKPDF